MKLCIVTHAVAKGDGQGRVNYEVAWEAIRHGHHVTLVASSVAPDLQQNDHVRWIPIAVKKLPTAVLQERAFALQSAYWIHQHRAEFDLIQVNGAITLVKSDVNAVHFVHSSWLKSGVHTSQFRKDLYGLYQRFNTVLNTHLERKALQQTKMVIAVSEKIKQEVIKLGLPEEDIRVVLNGVDLEEFHTGSTQRSMLGLPQDRPLALFAGDIRTPRKNLDTVLRAMVHVPNLCLVVAGKIEGSPYPKLADKLGVAHQVYFVGYQHDIANLMRGVNFFVFPSRYEACSLVLLEAMASGLPVVTTVTTGGSDIVTPECGLILTDSEDVSALAAALETLTNNLEKCRKMGEAARQVAENYSWRTQAKQYIDLFEEAASINS